MIHEKCFAFESYKNGFCCHVNVKRFNYKLKKKQSYKRTDNIIQKHIIRIFEAGEIKKKKFTFFVHFVRLC